MKLELIHDEEELRWFFDNVLPELAPHEVYFLSLSARNKYLSEQERLDNPLGKAQMFGKTIVREKDWAKFSRAIRRLECDELGYTTKNGSPVPSKCLVCYLNINPSDMVTAIKEFQTVLTEYAGEAFSLAMNNRNSLDLARRFTRLDETLLNKVQVSRGTRYWMDIDFDVNKSFRRDLAEVFLLEHHITRYYWIDTKSGFHLLIDKSQLKFNPGDFITYCTVELMGDSPEDKEIIINKNEMIPIPGTYQGGHKVSILNKSGGLEL